MTTLALLALLFCSGALPSESKDSPQSQSQSQSQYQSQSGGGSPTTTTTKAKTKSKAATETGVPNALFALNCGGKAHTGSRGLRYQADTDSLYESTNWGSSAPASATAPASSKSNSNNDDDDIANDVDDIGGDGDDDDEEEEEEEEEAPETVSANVPSKISKAPEEDQLIFQTERYALSDFSYQVPAPESDGDYVLVLRFSEVYFKNVAQKVFDVQLNGQHEVVRDLDILTKAGGPDTAHDEYVSFSVEGGKFVWEDEESSLENGVITVELLKGAADNPKICAIVLIKGTVDEATAIVPLNPADASDIDLDEEEEDDADLYDDDEEDEDEEEEDEDEFSDDVYKKTEDERRSAQKQQEQQQKQRRWQQQQEPLDSDTGLFGYILTAAIAMLIVFTAKQLL